MKMKKITMMVMMALCMTVATGEPKKDGIGKVIGGMLLDMGLTTAADQRASMSQVAPPVIVDKKKYKHTHPKNDLTNEETHSHERGNLPHNHKHSK